MAKIRTDRSKTKKAIAGWKGIVESVSNRLTYLRLNWSMWRIEKVTSTKSFRNMASKQSNNGKAADWLIRGQYDRVLSNDKHLIKEEEETEVLGEIEFDMPPGRKRQMRHVVQTLQSCRITLKGVSRPGWQLEDVTITVITGLREKSS